MSTWFSNTLEFSSDWQFLLTLMENSHSLPDERTTVLSRVGQHSVIRICVWHLNHVSVTPQQRNTKQEYSGKIPTQPRAGDAACLSQIFLFQHEIFPIYIINQLSVFLYINICVILSRCQASFTNQSNPSFREIQIQILSIKGRFRKKKVDEIFPAVGGVGRKLETFY